jgi:uncharacterized protein (DUF1697 family)
MRYAVLFKGINVGGKNVVTMNDLKQFLLDLGLRQVRTYIQSGNAVFESNLEEAPLLNIIRSGFPKRFGLNCQAAIRSIDEIGFLIEQLPIAPDEITAAETANPQVEHLYAYFLDHSPEQAELDAICRDYIGPDTLRAGKREVYLLCHESIRLSKLAVRLSWTFNSATARNWKTIGKLYEMLMAI